MRHLKQFIYRLIGLFLAFFPLLAFADSYKWSGLASVFAPEPSDLSMAFLSQIFGGAGGGLAAGGSSIMGEIFGVFNSGLLTITGLVLVYVTLRSITDTAMDGEAMGKKLNHWMAIRVAAGIGLLVPKASGYSILNSIVIWATVQGVGFADTVWNHSLEYLANGGVIYRQISSATDVSTASGILDGKLLVGDRFQAGHPPTVKDEGSTVGKAAGAGDIFRSLVCMHSLEEGIRSAQKDALADVKGDYDKREHYPKKRDLDGDTRYNQLVSYLQTNITLHPFFESSYDSAKKTAIAQVSFPGDELKNPSQFSTSGYYFLGNSQKSSDKFLRACCKAIQTNTDDHDCSSCFTQELSKDVGNTKGVCGVYSVVFDGGSPSQKDYDVYVAAKYAGLQQMVYDLDSAAKAYVTRPTDVKACVDSATGTVNPNKCFSQEYADSLANAVINAGGEYQTVIEPARILCSNSIRGQDHCIASFGDAEADKRNFAKAIINGQANPNYAGAQGWLAAGRYYFDIAALNDSKIAWDTSSYTITVVAPAPHINRGMSKSERYTVLKGYIDSFVGFTPENDGNLELRLLWVIKDKNNPGDDVIGVEPQAMNFMDKINTALSSSPNASGDLPFNTRTHVSSFIGVGDRIVLQPLSDTLANVYKYWREDLRSSTGFPLLNIHRLGMHVMGEVADCYNAIFNALRAEMIGFFAKEVAINVGSAIASVVKPAVAFWGVGINIDTTIIFQAVINIINASIQFFLIIPLMIALPLAISILTPLFATGLTLAYYVPLIPFMLFTFGTITWLISVIEAMAAAPLIALGITHPEGHDLLGKAEQAIMLLFSVFLRPVSMIIGLVASLILSYVALNVLNSGFNHVIGVLGEFSISDTNSIASSYLAAVVGVTILMIYLFIVLALMNQCFALIHVIPEKMMRWIGGHPETGPEAQLMESVKAGAGQFGEAASRGVGEAGGKVAGGAGEFAPTKQKYGDVSGAKKDDPGTGVKKPGTQP